MIPFAIEAIVFPKKAETANLLSLQYPDFDLLFFLVTLKIYEVILLPMKYNTLLPEQTLT